jgi:hypothetical protein
MGHAVSHDTENMGKSGLKYNFKKHGTVVADIDTQAMVKEAGCCADKKNPGHDIGLDRLCEEVFGFRHEDAHTALNETTIHYRDVYVSKQNSLQVHADQSKYTVSRCFFMMTVRRRVRESFVSSPRGRFDDHDHLIQSVLFRNLLPPEFPWCIGAQSTIRHEQLCSPSTPLYCVPRSPRCTQRQLPDPSSADVYPLVAAPISDPRMHLCRNVAAFGGRQLLAYLRAIQHNQETIRPHHRCRGSPSRIRSVRTWNTLAQGL